MEPSLAGGLGSSAMDYLGGFQYQDNVLKHFPTAEGYVSHVSGSYQYVYNYTDHLGNIRLSYGWDMAEAKLKIMEENHYYPFGMKHANYNTHTLGAMKKEEGSAMTLKAMAAPSTPKPVMGYNYKYNGKEFQDELGLNLYDYGARNYDATIGRWMNMDALAEKAPSWTPYRYAFNNPMFFVDPNGNYETDGHYWTVYLAGMLAGRQDAGTLAYYAEAPDNIMSDRGDIMNATNTWAFINWQVDVHAITGGYGNEERRISEIKFHNSSSLRDKGFALHRFGDSYAHSKSNGRMYDTGIGHALKGHEPDKIANRPELYLEYAQALTTMLGGFQKDMFTFEYVANNKGTTEQNSAILETEVRLQEGVVKSFSVSGNQVGTINNYMKARNEHTKSSTKHKATSVTGDIYRPDGNGGWNKTTETRTYVTF